VGGVEWVKAQAAAGEDVAKVVEKGKSQFVGPEISGKNLGVIGLGAIGVWLAMVGDWVVRLICFVLRARKKLWLEHR